MSVVKSQFWLHEKRSLLRSRRKAEAMLQGHRQRWSFRVLFFVSLLVFKLPLVVRYSLTFHIAVTRQRHLNEPKGSNLGPPRFFPEWKASTISPARLKQVILIQSCIRRFLCRDYITKLKVEQEIMVTERNYVNSLMTTVKLYIKPLKTNGILTQQEQSSIFSTFEGLAERQKAFLRTLESAYSSPQSKDLAIVSVFAKKAIIFLQYAEYFVNYPKAHALVVELLAKNQKFYKFAQACECKKESGFKDLTSFLIEPIQRVPRYRLLFEDLLRYSRDSEYDLIKRALKRIKDTAEFLNTEKRRREKQELAVDVAASISGSRKPNLSNQLYIFEGIVVPRKKGGQMRSRSCIAFLFTHSFLVTKEAAGKETYKVIDSMDLYELIDFGQDEDEMSFFVKSEKMRLSFEVVSSEESNEWVLCITKALSRLDHTKLNSNVAGAMGAGRSASVIFKTERRALKKGEE